MHRLNMVLKHVLALAVFVLFLKRPRFCNMNNNMNSVNRLSAAVSWPEGLQFPAFKSKTGHWKCLWNSCSQVANTGKGSRMYHQHSRGCHKGLCGTPQFFDESRPVPTWTTVLHNPRICGQGWCTRRVETGGPRRYQSCQYPPFHSRKSYPGRNDC